jgi:hypothetical protein
MTPWSHSRPAPDELVACPLYLQSRPYLRVGNETKPGGVYRPLDGRPHGCRVDVGAGYAHRRQTGRDPSSLMARNNQAPRVGARGSRPRVGRVNIVS